jgi:acyl-CoA thioesterase-1
MRAAFTAILTAQKRREFDVFQRVQRRDQHKGLKNKTDVSRTQRSARLFIKLMQRLPDQVDLSAAPVVQTGQNRQQRGLTGTGFTNQRDGFGAFDNEFNSGEDGKFVFPLTDGFLKTMNFNTVFRWHLPFLFLILMTFRAAAADTLLVLGDSLSAGYRMAASAAWPALLNDKWQSTTPVINASISGDTSQQGLSRLPALLKQHQPRWVLVELGGNDGLRGFQPQQTEQTLRTILQDIKAANARPLLMQIRLPANYGRRYNEAFSAIYPKLAKEFDIPLLPFFMEEVYLKPQWMQDDGIHPNRDAQPFIADWMATRLAPLVKHDS